MFVALVDFLVILVFLLLAVGTLRNVLTLLELFSIRRSIQQHRPPIVIPFLVFITRPLREIASTQLVRRGLVMNDASMVYGLALPLQLHASPFSKMYVKLGTAPGETPSDREEHKDNGAGIRDGGLFSTALSLDAGKKEQEGQCVVQNSHGHVVGEIGSESTAEFPRRKSCDRRGSLQSVDLPWGDDGSAKLAQLMARSQLSVAFRLEGSSQLGATWLRRHDKPGLASVPTEMISMSLFGEDLTCEDTMPFFDLGAEVMGAGATATDTTNTNATAATSAAACAPVELRCACIIGANDVDLMRAITIGTTQTFGVWPLSYHCHYTPEIEANCVRERMKLIDWHNRQRLGARFQSRDSLLPSSVSGLSFRERAVTHSRSARRQPQNRNLMPPGNEVSQSRRESFGSLTTTLGCTRSFHRSLKSNMVTETFLDASEMEGAAVRSMREGVRGEKQQQQPQLQKQGHMLPQEESCGPRDTTETANDGAFATAISASASASEQSSSSAWMDSTSSASVNTPRNLIDEDEAPATEPRSIRGSSASSEQEGIAGAAVDTAEAPWRNATSGINPTTTTATNITRVLPREATSVEIEGGKLHGVLASQRDSRRSSLFEQRVRTGNTTATTMTYEVFMCVKPCIIDSGVSSPAFVPTDDVELALAAIQNCHTATGITPKGATALCEATSATRKEVMVQGSKKGQQPQNMSSPLEEGVERGQRRMHPLALAIMIAVQAPPVRREVSRRERRRGVSQNKTEPIDCVVCVYSTEGKKGEALPRKASTHDVGEPQKQQQPLRPHAYSSFGSFSSAMLAAGSSNHDPAEWSRMEETLVYDGDERRDARNGDDAVNHQRTFTREGRSALLDAMRGSGGVELPMTLQYMRVGSDLYAVTEISDRTFVQYREERVLIGGRDGNSHSAGATTEIRDANGRDSFMGRRHASYRIGGVSYSLAAPAQEVVRMCWLCLREEADVIFWPCAHFAVCRACSEDLQKCCICQRAVRATIVLRDSTENGGR